MKRLVVVLAIGCISLVSSCSYISDQGFVPKSIIAVDVWVYDVAKDEKYFAGRIETNYLKIKDAKASGRQRAYSFANEHYLSNWSYVLCTVTNKTDCATEIR